MVLAIPKAKCRIIFKEKLSAAILSNSTRKLLWFDVAYISSAAFWNNFIVLFTVIFGTLSFPVSKIADFLYPRTI